MEDSSLGPGQIQEFREGAVSDFIHLHQLKGCGIAWFNGNVRHLMYHLNSVVHTKEGILNIPLWSTTATSMTFWNCWDKGSPRSRKA